MKKLVLFIVFCYLLLGNLNAQIQLNVGVAIPQGEFGEVDYNDGWGGKSGQASLGLCLGVKYGIPLKVNNLSFVFATNFIYNPLSIDFKDEYDLEFEGYNVDITYEKYLNIPIYCGLNYGIDLNNNLKLFGEGNIGANILKITNFKIEGNGAKGMSVYSPSYKFSFLLNGGVIVNQKYIFGINFFNLGSHKVKFKVIYSSNTYESEIKEKFNYSLGVNVIALTAGILF